MAGKKENLKSLFSNTRTRVIILVTVLLVLAAVVIGYIKLSHVNTLFSGSTRVGSTPGIESIPGALNPTAQYAQLQEKQNLDQAQKATTTGGSAIPTIIRTQTLGEGVGVIGSQSGQTGVGFASLARGNEAGSQKQVWLDTLQSARCSNTAINQVMSQGAQLSDLKAACTCVQLKDSDYTLSELSQICDCTELKAAGYNASQLKDSGFTAGRLRACGSSACELRGAGFSAQEMKDGGFSDDELKGAGFSEEDINKASGLPEGITAAEVLQAGCNVEALSKLRQSEVTASAIRRTSGCSIAQLKAAGFTAKQLRDAGFSAADLKRAGFTPEELRSAGASARDLLDAGFNPEELAQAGYSPTEINAAEVELPPGITPDDVKKAGCDADTLEKEKAAGVSATLIKHYAGCSAQALKAAGFTDEDLANAGFTAQQIRAATPLTDTQIKAAGCNPDQLRALLAAGVSAKRIKEINGCNAEALKAAGTSAHDLLNAGFSGETLAQAGLSPAEITAAEAELPPGITSEDIKNAGSDVDVLKKERAAGVSPAQMKRYAGVNAQALKAAGFTDQELANSGFTPQQISAAVRLTDAQIKAAGCNKNQLKTLLSAGVSAGRIKELNNCSTEALKNAGFSARSLLDSGHTPAQLFAAGFKPNDIKNAGLTAARVIANGRAAQCNVASLRAAKAAGVSALTIKKTLGCPSKALKDAGYSAKELKDAGFTAAELKNAGFNAKELKDAGFNAKALKEAGFSARDLKNAGFSAKDLKNAGLSAKDLKDAGFTAAQLKALGFSPKELKEAGFTAEQLKALGFNPKELKEAGFTAEQLKAAGFKPRELKEAGFSPKELRDAGFSAKDLKAAGLTPAELSQAGFSAAELQNVGLVGLDNPGMQQGGFNLNGIPSLSAGTPTAGRQNNVPDMQQVQAIISKQNQQLAEQKYQEQIQQKSSNMLSFANELISEWKNAPTQAYVQGSYVEEKVEAAAAAGGTERVESITSTTSVTDVQKTNMIKTGDVLFAVIDTSVNSDEPGPILATIVSGKLKGSRIIGSFNIPSTYANKMVITFNTLSIPGAPSTISISAYAIDPDTARTAVSSRTNNHYLLRYGSLFAASFLEGFGNAFQSANTTVTIGGTGSGNNVTVANGVGRSTLENAVIGLATLGKNWGQQAQLLFNTPKTIEVYAGTPVGILFTQDVKSI